MIILRKVSSKKFLLKIQSYIEISIIVDVQKTVPPVSSARFAMNFRNNRVGTIGDAIMYSSIE